MHEKSIWSKSDDALPNIRANDVHSSADIKHDCYNSICLRTFNQSLSRNLYFAGHDVARLA